MKRIPLPPAFSWRALQYDDLPALHKLLTATALADNFERVDSLSDLQTQFEDDWSHPALDTIVAMTDSALADGSQIVAYGRASGHPNPVLDAHLFLDHEVHPAYRQQGLEDALLNWLEVRGHERLQSAPATLAKSLRLGLQETETDKIVWLQKCGYQPVRYFYRMRRDLHQPIPAGRLPANLRFETYRLELDPAMYETYEETFQDHWGHEACSPTEWQQFHVGVAAFRPDLSLLVFEGDTPIGMSLNRVNQEDNLRNGRLEGIIAELGVRRPWRQQGVASALLCETMRRFRQSGLDYATLGVDSENPTGALGVYQKLGFEVVRRFILFAKVVGSR